MFIIYLIAFFSGLAVMGIELSATRLVAPYFGASLFVWTNVIGVILGALSLGYYLGGKFSERFPNLKFLLNIILLAGVLSALIPFAAKPVALNFILEIFKSPASSVVFIGSFFLVSILFFLPIMLLGMASPFLIKIVSLERRDIGNISGRIFAVSTLGSIVGAFLPALVFIPFIGAKFTILIFASVLILLGLARFSFYLISVVVIIIVVLFGLADSRFRPEKGLIAETESAYNYIQVIEKGGIRYLTTNEGGWIQSIYRPDSIFSGGPYLDIASLLPSLRDEKEILIIGLAAGTAARTMNFLYGKEQNFHIDGVEIDSKIIKLGKQFFELDSANLTVYNADGRLRARFTDKLYDIIFIDAYSNQIYIPFHLATKEFFALLSKRLKPGGVLAVNVNASSENSRILRSIGNTVASVFSRVYRLKAGEKWNYLIFASKEAIDFDKLREIGKNPGWRVDFEIGKEAEIDYNPAEMVLTDDFAPVEHMTDKMVWEHRIKSLISNP